MKPYQDALKFFLKYLGAVMLTSFLLMAMNKTLSNELLGLLVIFGPMVAMYPILVRLLKRYIAFYDDIATIRAEIKTYGEVKTPYSSNRRKVVQELRGIKKQDSQGSYNIGQHSPNSKEGKNERTQ